MRDIREILFRGERVDNGEWIYRSPFAPYSEWDKIDPSTVGQYTGLTDKNGVKIFEGDIIKTKKYGKICGHVNVNDFDVFVVQFEPCLFRLVNKNRGFNLVDDGFSKFEVIGNIHSNPELLEGGDGE